MSLNNRNTYLLKLWYSLLNIHRYIHDVCFWLLIDFWYKSIFSYSVSLWGNFLCLWETIHFNLHGMLPQILTTLSTLLSSMNMSDEYSHHRIRQWKPYNGWLAIFSTPPSFISDHYIHILNIKFSLNVLVTFPSSMRIYFEKKKKKQPKGTSLCYKTL